MFINKLKDNWQYICSFLLMIFIIFIMLYHIMDLRQLDLTIPMSYEGGDDMGILVNAEQMIEQGWTLSNDRLGAPYGAEYYDFTSNMMHNAGLVVLKLFVFITRNAAVATNLTYLSIFFMAGIISFFVMKSLKINCWVSSASSAVFAISPYMLYRGISHIVLTECYFVPLSILICIWIYERDDALIPDKEFFRKKINYAILFFTFLIANNGIAYYPFFTCFIFIVTAISKFVKTKKIKQSLSGIIATVLVTFFVVLSIIPGKIYSLINGVNSSAIERAGFEAAELYGLKISQMFMPLNGHGIYDDIIDKYQSSAFLINENVSAYLGIIGMLGFIILLICLFIKKSSTHENRIALLSELNISMVLLGTVGGLGAMFAFFITPMLRGYNRISIFIEYCCVLSVAIIINKIIHRIIEKNSENQMISKIKTGGIIAIFSVICYVSILEGAPLNATPDYEQNRLNYTSDESFVKYIESNVEEGAMIYQLPYHGYPEEGFVNDMWDYHLYIGYIHSKSLRWSYGSVKGREGDIWNKNISNMSYSDMVSTLKEQGFAGIYIDRRAYTEDELVELEITLKNLIGVEPVISNNSNLSFFRF